MNELCIRCNKQTLYHPDTPITLRRYYVEGSGQLCEKCWRVVYGNKIMPHMKACRQRDLMESRPRIAGNHTVWDRNPKRCIDPQKLDRLRRSNMDLSRYSWQKDKRIMCYSFQTLLVTCSQSLNVYVWCCSTTQCTWNILRCLLPCLICFAINQLFLQSSVERLHHGIVVGVSLSAVWT